MPSESSIFGMLQRRRNITKQLMERRLSAQLCGTAWLQEVEGEYTFGTCEPLRFSLHSECDYDFEFFNDWDSAGFLELKMTNP